MSLRQGPLWSGPITPGTVAVVTPAKTGQRVPWQWPQSPTDNPGVLWIHKDSNAPVPVERVQAHSQEVYRFMDFQTKWTSVLSRVNLNLLAHIQFLTI